MPSSRGSSQPRDRAQVSALWVYALPSEPPGKPKNTGVGSLSLLRVIFLTQELNQGFRGAEVKVSAYNVETPVGSLSWEDPLEKG